MTIFEYSLGFHLVSYLPRGVTRLNQGPGLGMYVIQQKNKI